MFNKLKLMLLASAAFVSSTFAQASIPDLSGDLPAASAMQALATNVAPIVITLVLAVIAVKVTIRLLNRGGGK